ncbi:ADP-ribosyl cyclase/cyclic ADP-ribose hydrolase-like isoform X1 [Ptychodera flava]|uniref:ADP-ribosyl cyclase/cyclic ADP-ribose hydrolase-like isoform X1 n=1 Tax=Ptychodera flava TaxID=63121 RepID=UPI00396A4C89
MDAVRLVRYVCLLIGLQGSIPFSLARRDWCDPGANIQGNGVKSVTVSDSGTPENLLDTFLIRCKEHKQKCTDGRKKDCHKLWNLFYSSFAYKDPCITNDLYSAFCDQAAHNTERDKTLLYSGTYEQSRDLGYTTLEDTLTGYMLDGIKQWCGQKTSPGINYKSCKARGECKDPPSNAQCAFWQQASIKFAQMAKGKVSILLDGSENDGAVISDSYLVQYEIPNLQKETVSEVEIFMIYTGTSKMEECGDGSVENLENIIRERGIKVTCKDFKMGVKTAKSQVSEIRASDEDCDPTSTGVSVGVNIGNTAFCLLLYIIQKRQ